MGPKTWKECSREEKAERTEENAQSCEEMIDDCKKQITDLRDEIEGHKHDVGLFRDHAAKIRRGETEEPANV